MSEEAKGVVSDIVKKRDAIALVLHYFAPKEGHDDCVSMVKDVLRVLDLAIAETSDIKTQLIEAKRLLGDANHFVNLCGRNHHVGEAVDLHKATDAFLKDKEKSHENVS